MNAVIKTPREDFLSINSSKANFDEIYEMDDPRGYFSVLGSLDYMIPDVAEPVVRQLLDARIRRYGGTPTVLDVGCSYGINAAVHRFPVTFATLRRRYARHEMATIPSPELCELDSNYYASWPDLGLARFVGLDASAPAIRYARRVGLIEHGIAADLEQTALAPHDALAVRDVDVVLSTGAIGYVTEKTYRKLLDGMPRTPWIVSFVLRMFPYDGFAGMLREYGLVTERLGSAVFVQRRFRDVEEFESNLDILAKRGIKTKGLEADGLFRAELFVSRPEADVRVAPLEELVTLSSGRNRPTGTRYVRVSSRDGAQVALEP